MLNNLWCLTWNRWPMRGSSRVFPGTGRGHLSMWRQAVSMATLPPPSVAESKNFREIAAETWLKFIEHDWQQSVNCKLYSSSPVAWMQRLINLIPQRGSFDEDKMQRRIGLAHTLPKEGDQWKFCKKYDRLLKVSPSDWRVFDLSEVRKTKQVVGIEGNGWRTPPVVVSVDPRRMQVASAHLTTLPACKQQT